MLWGKIVRVIRVESWEVFLNISRTVWNTATERPDFVPERYYGGAGAGSQEFTIFRIGAVSERGKVYGFLLSFRKVDFVLALQAAAKRT